MYWMLEAIVSLFLIGVALFAAWAIWAPMETLSWWAGWSRRREAPAENGSTPVTTRDPAARARNHFIVYLTAIGGVSTTQMSKRERYFLNYLASKVPDSIIIHDVFPFSVTNNPLTGQRRLAGIWQRLHLRRLRKRTSKLSMLIFLQNMFQVAVSADPRYGPIFNDGIAKQISDSLLRQGYPGTGGKRITLIAWSGSAQIAVGASQFLCRAFKAPIQVVSVGGVISNDPALDYIDHLYHLIGSKDHFFPGIGTVLCPGRWPWLRNSRWNQARRQGRITVIVPGPMRHTGREDYYDGRACLPSGQSYMERTADVIADRILDTSRSLPAHGSAPG